MATKQAYSTSRVCSFLLRVFSCLLKILNSIPHILATIISNTAIQLLTSNTAALLYTVSSQYNITALKSAPEKENYGGKI
jgi:hypothetical protein